MNYIPKKTTINLKKKAPIEKLIMSIIDCKIQIASAAKWPRIVGQFREFILH